MSHGDGEGQHTLSQRMLGSVHSTVVWFPERNQPASLNVTRLLTISATSSSFGDARASVYRGRCGASAAAGGREEQ